MAPPMPPAMALALMGLVTVVPFSVDEGFADVSKLTTGALVTGAVVSSID
jgi:hypothetical protein